jgi:hypothetical protein
LTLPVGGQKRLMHAIQYAAMRRLTLPLILLVLTGCRGTQPYSSQDLREVKQAYAQLYPNFTAFRHAYFRGQKASIQRYFRRNETMCRLADVIDKRDTIDPNVNLFQASIALDDMCNNVESVYALWAKEHHLRYDKSIVPSRKSEEFFGLDVELAKVPTYLKHPDAFA